MKSDIIWAVCGAVAFLALFGMMFASLSYEQKMKTECRISAMQKGYSALETQALCK